MSARESTQAGELSTSGLAFLRLLAHRRSVIHARPYLEASRIAAQNGGLLRAADGLVSHLVAQGTGVSDLGTIVTDLLNDEVILRIDGGLFWFVRALQLFPVFRANDAQDRAKFRAVVTASGISAGTARRPFELAHAEFFVDDCPELAPTALVPQQAHRLSKRVRDRLADAGVSLPSSISGTSR